MKIPNLSKSTKQALNALTEDETRYDRCSYAYAHEIIWYGIDALAHVHIMRTARDIPLGKLSLDDFINHYKLKFGKNNGFYVPLERIESDGIFIPPHKLILSGTISPADSPFVEGVNIHLFNEDYLNRVARKEWVDKSHAEQLIERSWQPSDFENQSLIEQGIKFGRDMWHTCVCGFNKYKDGYAPYSIPPQPEKITRLGEKLVKYYSAIISEQNPSK